MKEIVPKPFSSVKLTTNQFSQIYNLKLNYFLLKLNDEYSSLVWSMKKSLAKEIMTMTDVEFIEEINKSFVII